MELADVGDFFILRRGVMESDHLQGGELTSQRLNSELNSVLERLRRLYQLEGDPYALMDEAIALRRESRRLLFRAYRMESERKWNLLLERSHRLRQPEGDPSALKDEAWALLYEARRLYLTTGLESTAIDRYSMAEVARTVLDFLEAFGGIENITALTAQVFSWFQNDPWWQRNLFPSSSSGGAGYAAIPYPSFAIGVQQQSVENGPNSAVHFDHPHGGIESSITSNGANNAETWARWSSIRGFRLLDDNGDNSAAEPMAFLVRNSPEQRSLSMSNSSGGAGYVDSSTLSKEDVCVQIDDIIDGGRTGYGRQATRNLNGLFALGLEQRNVEDRLNREIHFDHSPGDIESSITSIGANGAEAWACGPPISGHHLFDGYGYNNAAEPMASSVQNSLGQRSLSHSSSRRGAGYAATWNHPWGGSHTQEGTDDWAKPWVLATMAVFVGAAFGCGASYPVIKDVFGAKWAPVAFGAVWVAVGMVGAGIIAALFDKSPKPKAFTKFAFVMFIIIVFAVLGFIFAFMIPKDH